MVTRKVGMIVLFFCVMANTLFSVQELVCDKTVVLGAVFFKLHGGRRCEKHYAKYYTEYKSENCKEKDEVKHHDNKIFISYHDKAGKLLGVVDITDYSEIRDSYSVLVSYARARLDTTIKQEVTMAYIDYNIITGEREIIFLGGNGKVVLAHPYKGKADLNDPVFKKFEKKFDLTELKKIDDFSK